MRQGLHQTALATPPVAGWPPDDTEESVVGTNLHQATIRNLCLGLNEAASGAAPPSEPASWHALSQTAIGGLCRRDGSCYTVLPDVFVYRHPIDERRATLHLDEEGPPVLIAEVLSPTTYESDLDLHSGKGYSYAQAGVRAYLVLDPTGEYVAEQIRGWRLGEGAYVPWQPDGDGRWRSRELGVLVGFEGVRVVVFRGDGRRQLREGEVARTVTALEERLAQQNEEIAALRRLLEERGWK